MMRYQEKANEREEEAYQEKVSGREEEANEREEEANDCLAFQGFLQTERVPKIGQSDNGLEKKNAMMVRGKMLLILQMLVNVQGRGGGPGGGVGGTGSGWVDGLC
ncbi:hypothetical protein LWI28_027179 [Acer negundo]|uniref:Uncharacterized protein n=1 Tax=Acer negundo TaxID=4023 RepID=A0AAD5NME6_ACENE|nr:hypothetical protein LWI28_027179 [Acer negundo]